MGRKRRVELTDPEQVTLQEALKNHGTGHPAQARVPSLCPSPIMEPQRLDGKNHCSSPECLLPDGQQLAHCF